MFKGKERGCARYIDLIELVERLIGVFSINGDPWIVHFHGIISNCKEVVSQNLIPGFALVANVVSFLGYSRDLLLGDFSDQRFNLERVEEER